MSTTVTRLHRCLVEAIHQTRPGMADRPVAVAEIYQSLVPYRSAREALGVEVNAEYEHALLRLLAGEGDLVHLEPSAARDELRRELRSPNPNVGLFRKFAACDVTVKMEPVVASPTSTASQDEAGAAQGATAAAPPPSRTTPPPVSDSASTSQEPAAATSPEATTTTRPEEATTTSCPFCRTRLPEGRSVRYCPSCGQDQRCRPCGSCGEVLEVDWRFCIACGAAAS